jgi:hypothetical protein
MGYKDDREKLKLAGPSLSTTPVRPGVGSEMPFG